MARDLLAGLGLEVDVQHLFCGGRDLLGIHRFSVKGKTMRILTILKAYFERKLNESKALLPEASISLLERIILTLIASCVVPTCTAKGLKRGQKLDKNPLNYMNF
jgi:hypothetical protein